MNDECDGCGLIKDVKSYNWKYEKEKGMLDLCEDCVHSYKYSGYKLEEC